MSFEDHLHYCHRNADRLEAVITKDGAWRCRPHPHLAMRDFAVSGEKGILWVKSTPAIGRLRPPDQGNTPLWSWLHVDGTPGLTHPGEVGSRFFLSLSLPISASFSHLYSFLCCTRLIYF